MPHLAPRLTKILALFSRPLTKHSPVTSHPNAYAVCPFNSMRPLPLHSAQPLPFSTLHWSLTNLAALRPSCSPDLPPSSHLPCALLNPPLHTYTSKRGQLLNLAPDAHIPCTLQTSTHPSVHNQPAASAALSREIPQGHSPQFHGPTPFDAFYWTCNPHLERPGWSVSWVLHLVGSWM